MKEDVKLHMIPGGQSSLREFGRSGAGGNSFSIVNLGICGRNYLQGKEHRVGYSSAHKAPMNMGVGAS